MNKMTFTPVEEPSYKRFIVGYQPDFPPMDKTIKRKWIRKLRAKGARQTRGQLYRRVTAKTKKGYQEEFCCLGVLGCIMGMEPAVTRKGESRLKHGGNWKKGLLPEYYTKKAGFSHDVQIKLAKMNDGGANFSEIADYIEDIL